MHSDEFICKGLRLTPGTSFLDVVGPNDIANVIALVKNSREMWDQDIRLRQSGSEMVDNPPEKKLRSLFTYGGGQKRMQGKSLWNKEGIRFFFRVEAKWKEIYISEEEMKIMYNGWGIWITTTGT